MKKLNLITKYTGLAIVAAGLLFSSCNKEGCTDSTAINYDEKAEEDDGSCLYDPADLTGEETKTGELTTDETWTANNIYVLDGKVVVPSGITLTIEPGTIIKGKEGQDAASSALVVARGGKLMAEGTADKPIIFTSILDNIEQGQKVGTNLTRTDNELWGGVVVCGNAPSSTENGDTEGNIEGIPADAGYGKYGGTDAADNSGVLKYISIRHGGITIGEGNELNGLTLGGVGTGTVIDNIEIYATLDDGVEFFGGTVNASNILVYYQGDDGLDMDQNYSGTVENFAIIHGDGIGTDESLEIDGPEGSTYTDGLFTLKNGYCKLDGSEGSHGDFKSKAQGNVMNVTFVGGKIKFRTNFVDPGVDCAHKSDAYKYLVNDNRLVFTGISLGTSTIDIYEGDETGLCTTELDAAKVAAPAAVGTGSGSTLDVASTFSWTAAAANNQL
jgi:hypothetical protein